MTTPPALACARVRVLLEPYVDGDLAQVDPLLAAAVREHLAGCSDCRHQHHQAVSVPFRLRALTSPRAPESLVRDVMRAVRPAQRFSRRAWFLLAPEAVLAAFIVWYLSGLEGLAREATSAFDDLLVLFNWSAGTASLPSVPVADVFLLGALIALALIAAYHLSVLTHLADNQMRSVEPWRQRRRA